MTETLPSIKQVQVDRLVNAIAARPGVFELPLTHHFTPGMYIREVFMPKGSLVVTKIHLTEHPFVISKGRVSVWSEGDGIIHLSAPHTGITKPGTRRVIHVHEDCVWTTFHPTNETDPARIEAQIIQKHEIKPDITLGRLEDELKSLLAA